MIPTTPSGTRTRWMRRPLGRTHPSTISPTGSVRPATWRRPWAIPATRERSRRSRSTEECSAPVASNWVTSSALVARIRSAPCSMRSADLRIASLLTAADDRATARAAALALCPSSSRAGGGQPFTATAYLGRAPAGTQPGPTAGVATVRPQPRQCPTSHQDDQVVTVNDLRLQVVGKVGGSVPGPGGDHRCRLADPPFGEHVSVGSGDLHRVIRPEVSEHGHHPGSQQGRAPLHQCPAGTGIDRNGACGTDGEGDPELPGRKATIPRAEPGPHP